VAAGAAEAAVGGSAGASEQTSGGWPLVWELATAQLVS
jgi:hypothetical protein